MQHVEPQLRCWLVIPSGHRISRSVFVQRRRRLNNVVEAHQQGHGTLSVHFYLQNVLKFSIQRLANEVQQIMHASFCSFVPTTMPGDIMFLQKMRL